MTKTVKVEIDQEVIDSTECDKGFTCLGQDPLYCTVYNTLGYGLLKLECQLNLDCRHKRTYGAIHACNCPVRYEIFNKYGK